MLSRRRLLATALATLLPGALLNRLVFATATGLQEAMNSSDLIYLTPLHANGKESTCQSEVWFVAEGTDFYVVTGSKSWRARAINKGLKNARIWVGDLGNWSRTKAKYKKLPQVEAKGTVISDKTLQAQILERYGSKYPVSWLLYKSRFRNGLADGTRIMLRYRPIQAVKD